MAVIELVRTIRNILNHPLNASARWPAIKRYIRWQVSSRIALGPTVVPFINDTHLIVTPGLTGATGNVYTGLYEFNDCAFLLHLLRPSDLFIDVGANVGVYTILASGVVGGHTLAIEPVPSTFAKLRANVGINCIADRVTMCNIGLGRLNDILTFTANLDTRNHIVHEPLGENSFIEVEVRPLDGVLGDKVATLIKIDVEGWESEVLAGGQAALAQPGLLGLIVEMNSGEKHLTASEQLVHDCLTKRGFEPYAYAPCSRTFTHLTTKNMNAENTIYVRDIEVVENRVRAASPFYVNGKEI